MTLTQQKKIYILILSFVTILTYITNAQDISKADFDRIDSLSRKLGPIYGNAVQATWINEEAKFWYLNRDKEGFKFYLVDADKKEKKDAFNHEKLSDLLSKKIGKTIDKNNLPFTKIDINTKQSIISFEYENKVWSYDTNADSL